MVAAALPQSLANDRRRALRRQPTLGTICRLSLPNDEHVVGLVWNISTTGLSMLVHRRLEAGASVEIEIATGDGANRLRCEFRIAHVAQMRTGDFIIGGQFGRCLEAVQMSPFVITGAC